MPLSTNQRLKESRPLIFKNKSAGQKPAASYAPDANQVENNFASKKRIKQQKEYIESTKAQYPSLKQLNYLAYLLDYPNEGELYDFVRFANGYHLDMITRVHFVRAIALAKKDKGPWGSAEDLVKMSFYLDQTSFADLLL